MGTWGHGNLDSDYALDELSTRTKDLLTQLLLRAQRKTSREYDEYDHTTLFVEFEIVFALDAAGLMGTGKFPSAAAVRALAVEFLAGYDAYMEAAWPERRATIEETFQRFAAMCEAHEGTAPLPSPPPSPAPSAGPKPSASVAKTTRPAKPKTKTKTKTNGKAQRR